MTAVTWTTLGSVLVLSVASRDAKGGTGGMWRKWTWGAFNDAVNNGSSMISVIEDNETIDDIPELACNISGEVTNQYEYGYVGWYAYPDDPTIKELKRAKSFSFKVLGDGQTYYVMVPTSDIEDGCYHRVTFTTKKDQEMTVTISMDSLKQPQEWGVKKEFNVINARQIQWQTTNNGRPGTFKLKIWDLKLQN